MSKVYITNKALIAELDKFHKTNIISKELHNMIYTLAKRIVTKTLFYKCINSQSVKSSDLNDNYLEVIHEGYVKCISRLDKFSMDKKNPFAYFTSVIMNAYKDFFFKEKRFDVLKQISQMEYEHKFLMKYGFKPIHKIDDEE